MPPFEDLPPELGRANEAIGRIGTPAKDLAWNLLVNVTGHAESMESIAGLKKKTGLEGDAMERVLLWHAARHALPKLPSLLIDDSVRKRLEQDLNQLHAMKGPLEVGSSQFVRAAKMATLRRFPAGPMEWELSGIPRSWFLKASFLDNLRLLKFVLFRLGGRGPCFFMHVAPAPRNRALTVPKEVLRSYYRIARSMELQPEVRALVAYAWFHDPAAVRDYPHLEVLNEPYLKHGGLITLFGEAPLDSGVLQGNAQRREDYIAGKIRYRYGHAVWPRNAAIQWAKAHPELAE